MLKKILITGCVLVALPGLYAVCGFYLLPKLARDKLPAMLTEMTGQAVKIADVHVDPFQLRADIQGFDLSTQDGKALLGFAELAVDVALFESIKQRGVIVESVSLRKPVANIERHSDGRFNFSDMLVKLSQPGGEEQKSDDGGAPLVLIHQLDLQEGHIAWSDMASGQQIKEALLPLSFSIADLTTKPDASAQFNMHCDLESGGGLDWRGDINLTGLNSQGQIKLNGIALHKIWQMFLQDSMPLKIDEGMLSLQADYGFNAADPSGLNVQVSKAGVDVTKLALSAKNQPGQLINLPELAVRGVDFDLRKQRIRIGEISSSAANIKAWLQADGQVNYQALLAGQTVPADPAPAASEPGKPWQVAVNQLALSHYQIEFTDRSQTKPVQMVLSELDFKLKDYNTGDAARMPVELSGRFNKAGSLKLSGNMSLAPFSADWALDVQAVKLKTFQAYLDPFINLELVDGDLNTQGQLQLKATEPLQVNYQGDANIDNLITRDKVKNIDFVKWDNLEFKQMAIDVANQDYKIAQVVFDQPYMRFMINKDRSNNVGELLPAKADAKPAAKPARGKTGKSTEKTKASEPKITIGKIEFKKGGSDFADYSLFLPFVAKMNDLSGAVDGFSSHSDEAVKLKLQGKVYDLASVSIKGNYMIKDGDSDIQLKFSNMPLPLITPYMADFAGYKIEKGQMALDLSYTIKKARLSAQNKIFIDQLVLGEKVDNPKAVSLPLELGIALLKDAGGKINLDFPITGSLESPEFSVGSLIADVFVNLITKAVTAPFKAIASLLGSDADLSTINFAAGSRELNPAETAKLDQIAKALAIKPELVLEIKGIAYQSQDWPIMRFDVLKDILKKMKSGELRDKGEKIRSEYIELSEDEYKRLLAKFYAEVFPGKIERSLLGKPGIKDKPDTDFYEQARKELEEVMQPEPQRLNDLAVGRANHITKYLAEKSGVDRARIFILATELDIQDGKKDINALLSLNVAS